jgi:hypothetical protein
MARGSMRRSNASTSAWPRTSARMTKKSSMNVVIFRPPAVPADPPPMSISTSTPRRVPSFISS